MNMLHNLIGLTQPLRYLKSGCYWRSHTCVCDPAVMGLYVISDNDGCVLSGCWQEVTPCHNRAVMRTEQRVDVTR